MKDIRRIKPIQRVGGFTTYHVEILKGTHWQREISPALTTRAAADSYLQKIQEKS